MTASRQVLHKTHWSVIAACIAASIVGAVLIGVFLDWLTPPVGPSRSGRGGSRWITLNVVRIEDAYELREDPDRADGFASFSWGTWYYRSLPVFPTRVRTHRILHVALWEPEADLWGAEADPWRAPVAEYMTSAGYSPRLVRQVGLGDEERERVFVTGSVGNGALAVGLLWVLIWATRSTRRLSRVEAGRCPECGYDLRSARIERCPECGSEIGSRRIT